jgi:hypothetical protein
MLSRGTHHQAGKTRLLHQRYGLDLSEVPATIPVKNLSAAMGPVSLNSLLWARSGNPQSEHNESAILPKADIECSLSPSMGLLLIQSSLPTH